MTDEKKLVRAKDFTRQLKDGTLVIKGKIYGKSYLASLKKE